MDFSSFKISQEKCHRIASNPVTFSMTLDFKRGRKLLAV